MNLEGFIPVHGTNGLISLTLSKHGLSLSKAAIANFHGAKYVRIFSNAEAHRILIKPSVHYDKGCIPLHRISKDVQLIEMIENMMGWDTNRHTYEIEGYYLLKQDVLLFDLKNYKYKY